jgi:hypothetical protein
MDKFLAAFALLLVAATARAQYSPGVTVPLSESDLQQIAQQVMQKHPVLSSSRGVKAAHAQRSVRSTDVASIVFYPHGESAGMKQALQARCVREVPDGQWNCDDVRLRRYLQLDSQNFEVRVTAAGIRTAEALALIRATRDTVQANAAANSPVPQTAIMILPYYAGYQVTWGTPDGQQELMVEAKLRTGGNPEKAGDWQTKMIAARD